MQSLAHQFLEFCRSKPADEGYDYWDIKGCACFQFLSQAGYPVRACGGHGDWQDTASEDHDIGLPDQRALVAEPWTFGALAARLEAALTEQAS